MDQKVKTKYEAFKRTVKIWENEFKKNNKRIPSKYDIKDAPIEVRQAYNMYYKIKTNFLSQTLNDCLNDDDEDESFEYTDISQNINGSQQQLNVSSAIQELIDPRNNFSIEQPRDKTPEPPVNQQQLAAIKTMEFEATEHLDSNDNAWNEKLKKVQPQLKPPKTYVPLKKKMSLNIEPVITKPMRNPRKALSKSKSVPSQFMTIEESENKEVLPDLETILLEKSRSNAIIEPKQIVAASTSDIKTIVDSGWLDRNTSSSTFSNKNVLSKTSSVLSATSSFGLSNLNIKSFTSSSMLNCPSLESEVKFHTGDHSDGEVIGNSDDESTLSRPLMHIAKKRRLSAEASKRAAFELQKQLSLNSMSADTQSPKSPEAIIEDDVDLNKKNTKVPEKPKRKSIRKPKQIVDPEVIKESTEGDFDNYDSDRDPPFELKADEQSPPVLQRKKSVIKRSKDGITKITKKATKLLTRSKKGLESKESKHDEPELPNEPETAEEFNFFIDSDLATLKTVPRASQKELKTTEKLFDTYLKKGVQTVVAQKINRVVDAKTIAKKEVLKKKIEAGSLNENFVRVNLKKKVFVRGKKAFSFSKYKKSVWKGKKAAALSGPDMDMRGCDGGVLKCFMCGGVGHFSQQCKQKGDSLLPIDAEIKDESPFPTLEEAAQMASDQKMLVHSRKPDLIPLSSNDIWKETLAEESGDEEMETEEVNKENLNEANIENKEASITSPKVKVQSYIGHSIPEDVLKKSGILEMTVGNKDYVHPIYQINADGSLPAMPSEVTDALKMFGHKAFRHGQEKAIMRILCGVSTLVTLSTGSGKSLCYQLPAYLYRKKSHCITLVISPLVSLMEDQVHGVPDFLNAQCLHTNQTPKQREKTMEAIKLGKVEILLVSPEAVVSGEKSTGFGSLLRQLPPIAFACIDEAHCVSQWSHNFRPSYLMICRVLREKLGVKTVLGLTATATLQTRESIVRHLGIPDGLEGIISDIPLPDNLILSVSKDENRDQALIDMLRSERFAKLHSIIIYCTRRDECERVAGFLRTCLNNEKQEREEKISNSKKRKRNNWNAEAYHAGFPASKRRTIQNAFMSSELRIVVATIAFGMGINKSDIRGIIHYNMPKSFESYVQEVGRAGRDGKPAHCHVFLDSKGNNLSELRRHIYANSIDRHVIRKLLKKVFIPCACKQHLKNDKTEQETAKELENNLEIANELENIDFNTSDNAMNMSMDVIKPRICLGHEVSISIDQTVQLLDIPEENISTLLCYLELHEQRYIKVLGNAYTMCKIISYSGPKYLKQIAKTCPPLAMAIAMDLKKGKDHDESASIEFNVVDVAAAIGWDSGIVKYQLKQLEWTVVNGANKRSAITVTFSELGFRIRSPGDLTDDELDMALDSLEKRASTQEKAQLIQLQIIFNSLASLAFPSFKLCSGENIPIESSNKLKTIIRSYFQTSLPMDAKIIDDNDDTADTEIISDIRQMIFMYPENNFSGRSLARIFHGISSPCNPAVIWGRCKYWRAHQKVNFNRLVSIGNMEIVRMRRIDST